MSISSGKSLAMMPFFVRDYVASTRHMSLAERGAYSDLLFFQWENDRLPVDSDRLARLIGCTSEEFAIVWPHIREKFVETNGALLNQRLEEHRAESLRLKAIRVKTAEDTNAKRDARRNAQRNGDRDADRPAQGTLIETPSVTATATLTGTSPSPSLSPSPNPSPSKKNTSVPRSFHDLVIAAYHDLLPDMPSVKVWSDKRRKMLDARIRERCKDGRPADSIEYWRTLFTSVAESDFLSGRTKVPFSHCCLEWLITEGNFAKVIEGNYANRTSNGRAHP
jgi:uncharacterized protein YdaU (DUF1376 family)